jgi:hypothetical protein
MFVIVVYTETWSSQSQGIIRVAQQTAEQPADIDAHPE